MLYEDRIASVKFSLAERLRRRVLRIEQPHEMQILRACPDRLPVQIGASQA